MFTPFYATSRRQINQAPACIAYSIYLARTGFSAAGTPRLADSITVQTNDTAAVHGTRCHPHPSIRKAPQ